MSDDIILSIAARVELQARYFSSMSSAAYLDVCNTVQENLIQIGVAFEDRRLPVSMQPTILSDSDVRSAASDLARVRDLMNRILQRFVSDLRNGSDGAPLPRFFRFYEKWFHCIAEERRRHVPIMLMRFDAVQSQSGGFLVMEPNAACPGGVIHCAYIRTAYRKTGFGRAVMGDIQTYDRLCDSPDGFIKLLYSVSPNPTSPRIALANYRGFYTNELESLRRRNVELRSLGVVDGDIIICDLRDIEVRSGYAYVGNERIDVVYNKIDQLMIDPLESEVAGWLAASRLETCEFLNSLASIYIGEAKSIFAALWDSEILQEIEATEEDIAIIRRMVPRTRMLLDRPNSPSHTELIQERHMLVAKADALTRGAGVHVGRLETAENWGATLLTLASKNPVIQDFVEAPSREVITFSIEGGRAIGALKREYWGVDFFYFGDEFAGVASRCSGSMIFNVGNGGQEAPTFVIAEC